MVVGVQRQAPAVLPPGKLRYLLYGVDWDNSVDMATRYELTVRGSNSGGGEIFRTCSDRPLGSPSLLYNGYRVFPRGKAAGAWR